MIARVAIALVIVGLVIGGSFLHKGPSVSQHSRVLSWSSGPVDAGQLEVQFSNSGVDFIRASDSTEPVLSCALLRRGDQSIAFDDANDFHAVEVHDGRLWVVAEFNTEGPGPTLEILVSEDEGRTFEHRASVPKPNYQAAFERWTVSGDELTLVLWLEEGTLLSDDWVWPWLRAEWLASARPVVGPGRFVIRSKNGGRTWRLER